MPIILALLLLFDVLVGVLVFVVLVQYLAVERTAVRTDVLNRLHRMTWCAATRCSLVPLAAALLTLVDGVAPGPGRDRDLRARLLWCS